MKELYEKLRGLNVVGHVEQKNGLNYLSWAWAWDEIMKTYPEASYEIERFDNKPYLYDEKTGYMVFTKVKIQDMEREMWLPVMDSNNNAMLDHEYTYVVNKYEWKNKVRTKVGEETKKVEAATMFDINKTIMRCLVKNLAMFGLGLALYSGEDLPEEELTEDKAKAFKFGEKSKYPNKTILEVAKEDSKYLQWWLDSGKDEKLKQMIMLLTGMQPTPVKSDEELLLLAKLQNLVITTKTDYDKLKAHYKVKSDVDMTKEQLEDAIKICEEKIKK